jgi:hypothetical protein
MRRRPRQAAVATDSNHSRRPAMLARRRGRQASRQWLRRPTRTGGLPGYPGNQRPPGPAGPGAFLRPRTSRSRRTSDIPVSRESAASAARQDQRPPSGPCGAETSRNCQTSGLPRVPCLEPAGPLLSPYRPQCPRAGRGHCRAGPAPVPAWLASPCRTGDGPDLLPNRQPGAAGCRLCVCSTACYGLTPRCREVKR